MRYVDRKDAGRKLVAPVAAAVVRYVADSRDALPLVLGIPRGGVVVAGEVAKALPGELGVALARKIGAPQNPELAIGAIGEYGEPVIDDGLVDRLEVSPRYLERTIAAEREEMRRRGETYRGDVPLPMVAGRSVVVVDDGIATGATLRAVLQTVRNDNPGLLVCAVPVGAPDSVSAIGKLVDIMICPMMPRWFRAVGEWYETFDQTTDSEVVEVLQTAQERRDLKKR